MGGKGSVSIRVVTDQCEVSPPPTYYIPNEGQPTSPTHVGDRIDNEEDGARVECTVARAGNGAYSINGLIAHDDHRFHIMGTLQPAGADGYLGQGTVQYATPEDGPLETGADACLLTVTPDQDVADGRVWGNFTCPTMDGADTSSPTSACGLEGSFVFEACAQ